MTQLSPEPISPCKWSADLIDGKTGFWETNCGQAYVINFGTPADNGMKYCCYCGGVLIQYLNLLESSEHTE